MLCLSTSTSYSRTCNVKACWWTMVRVWEENTTCGFRVCWIHSPCVHQILTEFLISRTQRKQIRWTGKLRIVASQYRARPRFLSTLGRICTGSYVGGSLGKVTSRPIQPFLLKIFLTYRVPLSIGQKLRELEQHWDLPLSRSAYSHMSIGKGQTLVGPGI